MAKKKDFTGATSMQFISQETIDKVDQPEKKPSTRKKKTTTPKGTEKAPEGYKINPKYIETKSKRVQMLIQPSLHEKAKAVSNDLGISLNDFINRAIQEAVYNEYVRELIEKSTQEER